MKKRPVHMKKRHVNMKKRPANMKKRPEDMKRDLNDILNTVHMKTDLDSREETCEQEKETEIYKKKYVDMK